jgi:sec-independent protein translocase protein TatB
MFGIGMQELLLILVIALIVLGPKKLPDVAKALGRALNEFKRATSDLKESLEVDHSLNTVKKSFDAMNDTQPAAGATASAPAPAAEVKPPSPSPEEAAHKTTEPPHAAS